jgi:hypothetical protein
LFIYFTRGTVNAERHLYPDNPEMIDCVLDYRSTLPSYEAIDIAFADTLGRTFSEVVRAGATDAHYFDRAVQKCFFSLVSEAFKISQQKPVTGVGFFSAGALAAGPISGWFSIVDYWSAIRPEIGIHFSGLKAFESDNDWTQCVISTRRPLAGSFTVRRLQSGDISSVTLKDQRGLFSALIAGERGYLSKAIRDIDCEIGLKDTPNLEGRPINAAHTPYSNSDHLRSVACKLPLKPPIYDLYGAQGEVLARGTNHKETLGAFFVAAIDGPLNTHAFLQNVRKNYDTIYAIGSKRALKTLAGCDLDQGPHIQLVTTDLMS